MYVNTFNRAMRSRFGCKVYKLSLDGGMTCPNRDGTLGDRGCIFCSGRGSGDFAAKTLDEARGFVSQKMKTGKFIAYFQSYTNTYAPADYLRKIFTDAIGHPDIVALDVATRPDCLPDEVVALLAELNREKPVWVELGLQTIHPETAEYIRRGYDLPVYDDAVKRLKAAGLEVIVHVILCLPGETREMMLNSVRYAAGSGVDGIKLQLLHVLKSADLYTDFKAKKFRTLELDEYISILEDCVRLIPRDVVIHRMTGDGAKADLAAPMWSADKKRVLNAINRAFAADDIVQGELLEKS
jgi:hypothetical protein